jgi:5-(carboxyamino)imidazole ribonucleotide synthase
MGSDYTTQRIGVLGAGQLGRMLAQAAHPLGFRLHFLDSDAQAPAAQLGFPFQLGSFREAEVVLAFGREMDIVTVEIEHVSVDALEALETEGKAVYPRPATLRTIQDKGLQKDFLAAHQLPTAAYLLVANKAEALARVDAGQIALPLVQKVRRGGYDGYGVRLHKTRQSLAEQGFDAPSVLEALVDIGSEIAVIVARSARGEIQTFPPVGMTFHPVANQVEFLYVPAGLSDEKQAEVENLARNLAEKLDLVGLLAVEFFLTREGRWLVNEMAPRPHNSGHLTIEACETSQFEQHLRAITGLPLGSTRLRSAAAMANLVGAAGHSGTVHYRGLNQALALPGVHMHLYGKPQTKPFRKMGHATVLAPTAAQSLALAQQVKHLIQVEAAE